MVSIETFKSRSSVLKSYSLLFIIAWTLIIVGFFGFGVFQIRSFHQEMAKKEALSNFNKDHALRLWATMHGGVYVPVTDETPSNPYLSGIKDRDIQMPDGKQLTLMNPAYMLRQIMENYESLYGIRGHLTSLQFFRPETAPDEWEKYALKEFEKGVKEISEFTEKDGKPYFLYMAPIITEEGCLKCHGHQGYKVGDVRGGVSMSLPMAPYLADQHQKILTAGFLLGVLWLLGLGGFIWVARKLQGKTRERDLAEAELRKIHNEAEKRERHLAIAQTTANLGSFYRGETGSKKDWTDQLLRIFGYSPGEIKPDYEFFIRHIDPEDRERFKSDYERFLQNFEPVDAEYGIIIKDGSRKDVRFITHVEPDRIENTRLLFGVFQDITEKKLMQRQILLNEKLTFLGFLISGIAHEINNPNNFITFNIPILREYLEEVFPIVDAYAEKQEEFKLFNMDYKEFRQDIFKLTDNIEQGSSRITKIVATLREFVQIKGKTEFARVDIKTIVERCVQLIEPELKKRVNAFELIVPENCPLVFTEPELLEIVIMKILLNAVQSADKKESWIKLKISYDEDLHHNVIIETMDNGCGMDKNTVDRAFEPFFSTRSSDDRIGLGLTLCQNLITTLRGRIEVESVKNQGSSFRIVLPIKK